MVGTARQRPEQDSTRATLGALRDPIKGDAMAGLAHAVTSTTRKLGVKAARSTILFGCAFGLIAMVAAGPASARAVRSRAWSGYQAGHQQFRHVAARWTVPALTCSGTAARGDADSYFSVALGPGSSNSERVGVREFCTGTLPAYVAYLGMNGLYEAQAIDPGPGDAIAAGISFASGKYRFSLADSTQGKSFSLRYPCGAFSFGQGKCSRSSAEVIAGISAPALSPLADYGSGTFRSIAITDVMGHRGSFARNRHWRVARLDEYDGTALAARPSSLSHRGTRFTVTWHGA
jgi:peptidase A4-like protein